jgi:translation initiation factor 3 subunit L
MTSSDSDSDGPRPQREVIPEAVDSFLGNLEKCLETRNVAELKKLYEDDFNKLSEKHYNKNGKWSPWPNMESVQIALNRDPDNTGDVVLVFYKELYYRHIYAHLQPTYEHRKGSWENYTKLLNLIILELEEGEELSVALPAQWIWDLLDEFVYHYQTYCNARNKAAKKANDSEIRQFKENLDVFETKTVLNTLHTIIRVSLIEEYLANPENPNKRKGAFTSESVRLFGYFALLQLLRMHSILGDYHLAMKTIERIDFGAEVPLFYQIPACHVTLFYYMGFAYLMLRRYVDSIRTFNDILAFLAKTTGVNSMSYQHDAMVKKQEQMYALLLLALALCPRPLDEGIERTIRDKTDYRDKQARLQRGEEICFEELFQYACPKFVSPANPDFDNTDGFNPNEAHQRQMKLFLSEVKQQQFLPKIGAYMKLYTAISTSKLATLCEMDEEALRDQLMCVMHKTMQKVRNPIGGGAPLAGETQSCSEVDFYLDGDMVHINAQREERPHSEVFLEHIIKYQDLLKKMGKA